MTSQFVTILHGHLAEIFGLRNQKWARLHATRLRPLLPAILVLPRRLPFCLFVLRTPFDAKDQHARTAGSRAPCSLLPHLRLQRVPLVQEGTMRCQRVRRSVPRDQDCRKRCAGPVYSSADAIFSRCSSCAVAKTSARSKGRSTRPGALHEIVCSLTSRTRPPKLIGPHPSCTTVAVRITALSAGAHSFRPSLDLIPLSHDAFVAMLQEKFRFEAKNCG